MQEISVGLWGEWRNPVFAVVIGFGFKSKALTNLGKMEKIRFHIV